MKWSASFKCDPLPPLIHSENLAVRYFAERDLLGRAKREDELWEQPEVIRVMHRQKPDGSWKYPGGNKAIRSQTNYDQMETYRRLGIFIEKFALTRKHPSVDMAARFLFAFQTDEGDFRGIYGNQYTPNYSAAITELLIKAGYEKDKRIDCSMKWLLSIRQGDGSWAIPFRTRGLNLEAIRAGKTVDPDLSMPSSHLVTGVVLRAFAAHPKYRGCSEATAAGTLLKSRFFKRDSYPDRRAAAFWTTFPFPFWFTDLISSLDSLSRMGFDPHDPEIARALKWFVERQSADGLWRLRTQMNKDDDLPSWISLSICRIFKRFHV
jgi:hypothetical protein